MLVRDRFDLVKSFHARKFLGWLLPVLVLLLLGRQQAYAGSNQWTSNGPYGGDIEALVVDPANTSTLYAGTQGGGLYKSTDSGANWSAVGIPDLDLYVNSLAIDPADSSTIYAGAYGLGQVGLPSSYGVFKSTNGGANWTVSNTGLTTGGIFSLAIDPANTSTIYAGTDSGVFKSTDGGTSWTTANIGMTNPYVYSVVIDPANTSTLYAGTLSGGVFKSTNGGTSWAAVNTGLTINAVLVVAIDPANTSTIYAGTNPGGVFKSTNGGASWAAFNTGLTAALGINSLAIDPTNSSKIYAGNGGVGAFRSTNGGTSWTAVNTGLPVGAHAVVSIAIDPTNGSTIYLGHVDAGVFKTTNSGANWTASTAGIIATEITALAVGPTANPVLYAGTVGGSIFKSSDGGATWSGSGPTGSFSSVVFLAIDQTSPSTVYASTYNGLFKSTDGGSSWTAINAGLTGGIINSLAIDPARTSTLYAAAQSSGVFKTTNGGTSWTVTGSLGLFPDVISLAVDPSNSSTLYAGTLTGIFKSTNGGATWTAVNTGLSFGEIDSLAVDPTNGSTIYAGSSANGVFKSTNGGTNWTLVSGFQADSLVIDPANSSTIYAGVNLFGVQQSTEAGTGFSSFNTGLTDPEVHANSLAIESTNIYAGTYGGGVFAITYSNSGPAATNVNIIGTPAVGQLLTGNYTYSDLAGDLEGASTFRWLLDGTTLVGTAQTYSVVGDDLGHTITFEVTPVAVTGTSGTAVASPGVIIGQGVQIVTFTSTAPTAAKVGAAPYTVTATGGASGNPVTFTIDASAAAVCSIAGSTVSFTGVGTCVIDANELGNTNYAAAPQAQQSFAVGQAGQVIAFTSTAPAAAKVGAAPYTVTATGGASGNPVTFTIDASAAAVCTIAGSTVSFTGVGTCVIDANELGNTNYAAAAQAQQSFAVAQAVLALGTVSPANATAGAPAFTLTVNGTGFVNGATVNFNGSPRATSFVSSTQLTAAINVADIASAGWDQVTVSNPSGAGTSNAVAFQVAAGSMSPTIGTALYFVPVTPCRLVDTRNTPNDAFAGPSITGGTTRNFTIPQNTTCNIPSTAAAYSLNVAVIPSGSLGFLTLWPAGQTQPVAATVSSIDGRVRSNAAIVPAGTGGAISVFASNTTDVVMDINGYFTTAPTNLQFYPVAPCRVLDTRNANGPLGGPSITGNTSRTFPLPTGSCNLPGNAQAYSLNLAVVPQEPLGFLTAWPTGQTQPGTANLSSTTGTVTASAAIVPAGTSGSIDVYASNTTDLIIDVNGYFAPAGTGGLSLYTLPPCRVLDTRQLSDTQTMQPFSGELDENIQASACGVPVGAQAYVLNATVVPPAPLGFLTLWPQGTAQPVVATLSALDATVTSNLAIVPTTNGSISTYAANPTQLIMDMFGYFAPTITYTIGGTVSGLSGTGLVLQDDGGNNLAVSAGATSFTFPTAIFSSAMYNVTVLTQPSNPAQTCAVTNGSGTASANITNIQITCTSVPAQVATPMSSIASGTYTSAQMVTISDATTGATIYYTTNGTTPTSNSTKYAGAIAISASETLKAIVIATGFTDSAVATDSHTINLLDMPGAPAFERS